MRLSTESSGHDLSASGCGLELGYDGCEHHVPEELHIPASSIPIDEQQESTREVAAGGLRAAGRAGERLAAPTILLLLIAALAAALRFSHLADKSFWFDEGFSVGIARLGWHDFLQLLARRELNMAPYYLLLKGWLELGKSEFFVRGLSVLAALAALPAVSQLGKRLFGARVGLTAALLLAVNAYHVRYSQEARSYTLLVLLSVLSSLWLVKAVEKPARRTWLAYAALSVLVVYSHFYGVLVIAAQWASLLIMRRHGVGTRQFLRSACGVVVLCLPIAITALFAGTSGLQFVPPTSAAGVWQFAVSLAGNAGGLLVAAYSIPLAAAAGAAWTAWRKHGRSFELWRYGLLFSWLVVPIALVLAGSVARPMFVGRYLISSLPALVLLLAAGIWRLRPGWVRVALIVVLLLLSLRGVLAYYQRDFDLARDDWRSSSRDVISRAAPGDAVFFYTAPGRMPFEYYRWLEGKSATHPLVIYPAHAQRLNYRDFLVEPLAEILPTVPTHHRRVWLVLNQHGGPERPDMGSQVMRAWFGERYTLTGEHDFAGIEVLLYAR